MPKRKIRVLQLIDGLGLGGAEVIVLMLAKNLDRGRFEVIPCALRRSGPLEKDLLAAGIDYRVLGLRRRSVLTGPLFTLDLRRMIHALSETFKKLSIDVVHAHLTESTLAGILAARQTDSVRVCATLHNIVLHSQRGRLSPREWLMRTAINQVFSKADCLIAVSEEVRQSVQRHTRIPEKRILTIHNAVDSERFHFGADKMAFRRALHLPTDRLIVSTIGRLTRQKGYLHLLGAVALIPPQQRPLTLIIGDGPDRDQLETAVKASGLTKDVLLLGNRHDVPDLLAASDLFVLSSLWEGLPLALLEAAASGLAAVVTAVGGNTEVVKDGESGILVQPGDEKGLAEAICDLLTDPAKRNRMGGEMRSQFDHRYSLPSFIDAHARCYEWLLNRQSGDPEKEAQYAHIR